MPDRPPPTPKPRCDAKPPPPASSRQKPEPPPPEGSGSPQPAASFPSPNESHVDRVLFDNLVEVVPLIESLMGQRANSSFRRRASVVYTPAPPNPKKAVWSKGQKSSSGKKRREDNPQDKQVGRDKQDGESDEFSVMSSRSLQKERKEMNMLREQVDDLQKRLVQKNEQMKEVEGSLNELKHEVMEKDALIRSTHSQLNNAKNERSASRRRMGTLHGWKREDDVFPVKMAHTYLINPAHPPHTPEPKKERKKERKGPCKVCFLQLKLADKQAALEKSEWEAREAKNNNMKLQGKLDSIDLEISSFMHLFMELSKTESAPQIDDDITYFHNLDQLPILDVDENAMEEARVAYVNALAAAKENPTEETLSIASEARMRLQSFVL